MLGAIYLTSAAVMIFLVHRAGFLLSRVDGFTSLEELLDLSGMPRLEALKTVLSLVDAGAIMIPR